MGAFMRIAKGTAAVGLCLSLVACASLPNPPQRDGIEVERIVDAVQCELGAVWFTKYGPSLRNWLARTTLTLKVTNDASTASTLTVTPPVASSSLTVPIGPDLQDTSIRTAVITFDVHLRDLDPKVLKEKGLKLPSCPWPDTGLPQAQETLGLYDWLTTVANSAGRNDHADLNAASYNIEFTVARGLHGGVKFKTGSFDIDAGEPYAKKTNYNQMIVALTDDPQPVKKAVGGKTKTSPGASQRLDNQIQRFLPQRLLLQPGSGSITIQ